MVEFIQIDDCWNKIGVWSRTGASCPRLTEMIHCRNCEVYSAAGRLLLQREIPQGAALEWAERYAEPVKYTLKHGISITLFRIGMEWLAIPTKAIKSIGDPAAIRRIPHRSHPALRGMANLAGDTELVVSLEALLGIEAAGEEATDQQNARQRGRPIVRMMRVIGDSGPFAFEVAEVSGTHRYEEGKLDPVPSTLEKALLHYVSGTLAVDGKRVGVLDMGLVAYRVEQTLK